MGQIEPIIPQEGKPGMTVDDLVFHKHEMAQSVAYVEEVIKEKLPENVQEFMNIWTESVKSIKHAIVAFPSGSILSVITGTPTHDDNKSVARFLAFARGDERVPTYEVSISMPGMEDDVRNYQTPSEVNAILVELSSRPG